MAGEVSRDGVERIVQGAADRRQRDRIELRDLVVGQIGVMNHITVAAGTTNPITRGNRRGVEFFV